MYVKTKDDQIVLYPYGYKQLQEDNPYTIFQSSDIVECFYGTEAWNEGYRIEPVVVSPEPIHDDATQVAVMDSNPSLVDGTWTISWTIRPMNDEETAARKKQIKDQASKLLADTDWVDVPSVSDPQNDPHLINKDEFNSYRLALRKIAVYMPVKPDWPTKPEEVWGS